MTSAWRKPVLILIAVIVALVMVRLGVWQLGRADEKQAILDQQSLLAEQPAQSLQALDPVDFRRFLPVFVSGRYMQEKTVLVDNQVFDSKVGYRVFTPFSIQGDSSVVMVDRGWIPLGPNRENLPAVATKTEPHQLVGRLNLAPAKPPLWNEDYTVHNGSVWQYLPLDIAAQQLDLPLVPMVLELAPAFDAEIDPALQRRWRAIDDKWVAKHKAYALQWFAMSVAWLIAILIVILRSNRKPKV